MIYMGSKASFGKEIMRTMLSSRPDATVYVEPFAGGMNMMKYAPPTMKRIGNDINEFLIAMWRALDKGWTPPKFVSRAL